MFKKTWLIYLVVIVTACHSQETDNMIKREINSEWRFIQANGVLAGTAKVPGTIHTDLLHEGIIGDPFYRTNEKEQQWIDKEDWEYQTSFDISREEYEKDNLYLKFNGLDTYADVYLNDSLLLKADNMFRQWEINIKSYAFAGTNHLRVYFHSPIRRGLELLEDSPYPYPAINDQSEIGGLGDKKVSVFTRKAPYHFGWDWGPRLVTSGIWRPLFLMAWDNARIKNLFIRQLVVNPTVANLVAEFHVEANNSFEGEFLLVEKSSGQVLISEKIQISKGDSLCSFPFAVHNPKLWWSKGMGNPDLYNFEVKILTSGKEVACQEVITGLRSLKLIRKKDEDGESFYFELNGKPVFIKGANYIPNDVFLPRVSKIDYDKVIADAIDANMNMLRVWGGGVYEDDYFYSLCDKSGLLVWQDFMFACSMYPGNKAFLENVKNEAIDNVVRLRNHPCIALWCGNNEINTAWHYFSNGGWGWKERYSSAQQEEIQQAYMDLFHGILPRVVGDYTDGDDYWPSSPQAGYEPEKHAGYENKSGDMHYWGVWHGLHDFDNFEKYIARFMSEYGFQSFPDIETIKKYALPNDFDIESEVMSAHQRSGIGNLRIKEYMGRYYKVPTDFTHFIYMSQVLQAKGIKMAIEAHRRAMPYCMGTMYWQINDCWPVASWSSTDYYHKWKALHYAVRKAYQPISLSALVRNEQLLIYGVSDSMADVFGELNLLLMDFDGTIVWKKKISAQINHNSSSVLQHIELPELIGNNDKNGILLKMEFLDGKETVADNIFYFTRPKNQILPMPQIKTRFFINEGKNYLEVTSDKLARNIFLNFEDQEITFSDNYFDLLPGETRLLELTGAGDYELEGLRITHLQQVSDTL